MDIHGDKLAETQIAEYTQQGSRGHRNMLRYLRATLRRGDVYSTCGQPQRYALVGELGMASRLNRHTLGYEFVYPVLPGAPTRAKGENRGSPLPDGLVPTDAFVVLWCGGYNVWTDADTLSQALDEAMCRDPRIVFVSVGGQVRLRENDTYARFLATIETSAHRHRFHMPGWRPVNEIPAYYRRADAGVSLDSHHYETLLGTRTRLVEMMSYGLPVITSLGCELSTIIRDQELGLTFPIGDATAFTDRILTLAEDSTQRQVLAERARGCFVRQLSFAETTRPFRKWASRPYHAPDRGQVSRCWDLQDLGSYLRSVVRGILWRIWGLERAD
jgi:glycosyltransferase involved in cell wall biosynthesis